MLLVWVFCCHLVVSGWFPGFRFWVPGFEIWVCMLVTFLTSGIWVVTGFGYFVAYVVFCGFCFLDLISWIFDFWI